MLKRKPKTFTPEQTEEIRTKDFFDMILPGTVKFLSDRYILGDSYRCVGAIREYPPLRPRNKLFFPGLQIKAESHCASIIGW